jgi:hypothetical protein
VYGTARNLRDQDSLIAEPGHRESLSGALGTSAERQTRIVVEPDLDRAFQIANRRHLIGPLRPDLKHDAIEVPAAAERGPVEAPFFVED